MDSGPEVMGPYDTYMTFSLENIGRTAQKWPFRGEVGLKIKKKQKFTNKSDFQKSPLNNFQWSEIQFNKQFNFSFEMPGR